MAGASTTMISSLMRSAKALKDQSFVRSLSASASRARKELDLSDKCPPISNLFFRHFFLRPHVFQMHALKVIRAEFFFLHTLWNSRCQPHFWQINRGNNVCVSASSANRAAAKPRTPENVWVIAPFSTVVQYVQQQCT